MGHIPGRIRGKFGSELGEMPVIVLKLAHSLSVFLCRKTNGGGVLHGKRRFNEQLRHLLQL